MENRSAATKFVQLLDIMQRLRSGDGCPWDRQQTHVSLVQYLIEEAHETAAAVDSGTSAHLAEELGDVLLQIVFHAQIGTETGQFTIDDVLDAIIAKLIRRHPHVFGDLPVKTADDVLANWHQIKTDEKSGFVQSSILDDIPRSFPQLMVAQKCQERAARVGFDWEKTDQVRDKVMEEWGELWHEVQTGTDLSAVEEEFGDLLFAIVNLGRFLKVSAEEAMRKSNQKFLRRFAALEKRVGGADRLKTMTLAEMDALWEVIKSEETPPADTR